MNKSNLLVLILSLSMPSISKAQHASTHQQDQSVFLSMMDTMMVRMEAAPAGISPGYDFLAGMIPHHEGAVSMAEYEIEYGKNFTMIQLAKSILTEQTNEIQLMNLYLNSLSTPTAFNKMEFKKKMDETMKTMMDNMPANVDLHDVDSAFAQVMIPHHQAAIDMAKVVLQFPTDQRVSGFARHIISSQEIEIEQMFSFLNKK